MRKIAVVLLTTIFSVFFFTFSGSFVYADDTFIESIDIHVQLDEDGGAQITEEWRGQFNTGTELYFEKKDLEKSEISNFTVTGNGQVFEYVDQWDLDASLEEKAFKNSIIKGKNSAEIVWGISEYGSNEYVLEYYVSNIIDQLKDTQVLYWFFASDNYSIPRNSVNVTIESFEELHDDTEDIWAFGFRGDIEFGNNKVVSRSSTGLGSDDYVSILIKFTEEPFKTENKINKKFKKVYKEASKESDYDAFGFLGLIGGLLFDLIKIGLAIGAILVALFFINKNKKPTFTLEQRRKFSRRYKEEYYRDYPYDGNHADAYFIPYMMGTANFNTVLTSLLLKWVYEDKIIMTEATRGMLRRTQQTIQFLKDHEDPESPEGKLFTMLKGASDKEGYVTDAQIAKWAKRRAEDLQKWERNLLRHSAEQLTKHGFAKEHIEKKLFSTKKYYRLTANGKELEANVYKYINYLHDFSLMHEHEAVNVKLWDEIMIWAAMLNLTKVVSEQFKKLYPNYEMESKFRDDSLNRTRRMSRVAEENRREELRRRREQRRRSSGSGGAASYRGGGGARGGGSGGVR